jgi:hypothetical protein
LLNEVQQGSWAPTGVPLPLCIHDTAVCNNLERSQKFNMSDKTEPPPQKDGGSGSAERELAYCVTPVTGADCPSAPAPGASFGFLATK